MLKNKCFMAASLIGAMLLAGCSEKSTEGSGDTSSAAKSTYQSSAPPAAKKQAEAKKPAVEPGHEGHNHGPGEHGAHAAKAQNKKNLPPPRLTFSEISHKFGTVVEGDKAKHSFKFVNESSEPVTIKNVRPSCGCTAKKVTLMSGDAEVDYEMGSAIPPGGVGAIEAILNTTGARGRKASRVTVYTNDPNHPTIVLNVEAQVERLFQMDPASVHKSNVVGKVGAETIVKVKALKADAFEITGWEELPAGLEVEVVRGSEDKPNEADVKISFNPGIKEGIFNHQLILKAQIPGHEEERQLRIPITATILGSISVQPVHCGFGLVRTGNTKTIKLTITNRDPDHELKITDVTIESAQKEFLSAEVKPDLEGQTYFIEVTVSENCPKGFFKGKLNIATNSEETPSKSVNITGVVR